MIHHRLYLCRVAARPAGTKPGVEPVILGHLPGLASQKAGAANSRQRGRAIVGVSFDDLIDARGDIDNAFATLDALPDNDVLPFPSDRRSLYRDWGRKVGFRALLSILELTEPPDTDTIADVILKVTRKMDPGPDRRVLGRTEVTT